MDGEDEVPAVVVNEAPDTAGEVAMAQAVEARAEAEVEIAQVHEDAQTDRCEIEAKTERQVAELAHDAQLAALRQENEACRTALSSLEVQVLALTETIKSLTPPPSQALSENPSQNLGDGNEGSMPVSPEAQEEKAAPEPPARKRPFRLI